MAARPLVPVLHDALALLGRHRETARRVRAGHRSVHRPRLRNLGLAAVVLVLIRLGTVEQDDTYDTDDRWRVAISLLIGGILLVRVLRRGTVLSAAGIERRGTIDTWRVPWSAVADISPPRECGPGSVTVTLTDGSTRWSTGSGRRRGRPDLLTTAASWHRHAHGDDRWARAANRPLVVLLGAGVVLVTAMAMASTHRANLWAAERGLLDYSPAEMRELRIEIAVTSGLSLLLAVVVAVALVGALVRAVRPRVPQSRSASDVIVSNGASGWSP
jgi:hypothetical protein